MDRDIQELAEKHSLPTLDYIDRETGDRVNHYLFTEDGLERFVRELGERK